VPAAVRQRILLFYVFNWYSLSGGGHWLPQQLRDGVLSLTVDEASAKKVRLRLHGHASFKDECAAYRTDRGTGKRFPVLPTHETGQKLPDRLVKVYDVKIEGALEYDPVAKKLTRFDAVALGDYRGTWGIAYKEKPIPVGIAFQVDTRKLGPEQRHAPYGLSAVREHYWAADRWRPKP
jgi:hypothetical protein